MSDFDPSEHNVDEVVEHLSTSDSNEIARVLDAEAEGKSRSTVLNWEGDQPKGAPAESATSDSGVQEFEQSEENATLLLAAAAELGLDPSVVTTLDGGLQAPDEVVVASDLSTDKD